MKLLASYIIFTELSTKTLFLWRCRVSFEYQRLLQNTPALFLLLLSMFKLRCKRHYRNLATYSWCSTWREHVTKTALARRRHSVGGGGAAAHSSSLQDKTLDMQIFLHILASTKNVYDNLGACQAVGGRLTVDNRRYRLPVRLCCCCLHCRTYACENS